MDSLVEELKRAEATLQAVLGSRGTEVLHFDDGELQITIKTKASGKRLEEISPGKMRKVLNQIMLALVNDCVVFQHKRLEGNKQ